MTVINPHDTLLDEGVVHHVRGLLSGIWVQAFTAIGGDERISMAPSVLGPLQ